MCPVDVGDVVVTKAMMVLVVLEGSRRLTLGMAQQLVLGSIPAEDLGKGELLDDDGRGQLLWCVAESSHPGQGSVGFDTSEEVGVWPPCSPHCGGMHRTILLNYENRA